MHSSGDPLEAPLPIPVDVLPAASRLAVLKAMFDAIVDGRIGTPQERLAAIAAKQKRDVLLTRYRKLPVKEQGEVWLRLAGGDDPEELLPE
jgi:hypothetical protein